MSQKIKDVADKLGLSSKELKEKLNKLGFEIKTNARTVEDDVAELVISEFSEEAPTDIKDAGAAKVYEEIYDKEEDREIIKKQRKKTAGKKDSKDKKKEEKEEKPEVKNKGAIEISAVISVKEFAEKTGLNAAKIIGELMKNGILANINQQIDFDTASIVASDLGIKIKKIRDEASIEDLMSGNLVELLKEDEKSDLEERPPVISIMGHVDHGKTKILDYIRKANVVDTESGGITQHIGAYQVEKNNKKITFLDTPGHEAFTAMRARGAKATDIAILVVAADEGVKPQTVEAINHARDAGIPIIVAINKIDKENANPDRVKGELAEHDLQPEDWGGKTIMAPVSAITGEGMDNLLDMILIVAEMEDLKANPERAAVGTVIESHLDKNLGPIATVLINTGTLKIMDNVVIGSTYGRIKVMKDHNGKNMKKADPSTPVLIAGLSEAPLSGDILQVVKDDKTARTQAQKIALLKKNEALAGIGAKDIISQIISGKLKTLKLVIKADTKGSLEAILQALDKIKDEEVAIKVIHSGVGNVTEGDVIMASASAGVVIGFHVDVPAQVEKTAERESVDILKYTIIYNLIEDITKLLAGLIEPEIVEVDLGKAEVKQIFFTSKKEMVIGCKVTNGKVQKGAKARLMRKEEKVDEVEIASLKRVKEAVDEIKADSECGIKLKGKHDIEEGDILEVYKLEKKIRTLE
ncbi:translation initiation factor IF-2 [Patescibacteria group bacterium]